ncbi:uncharacterized protein [Antedon mediterranea]
MLLKAMDTEKQFENEEDISATVTTTTWIMQLWYSDDIQIRICRLLVYSIIVLLFLIYVAWRLYGPVISNMYIKQVFSNPTSPERDLSSTRCEDVPSSSSSDKKTN